MNRYNVYMAVIIAILCLALYLQSEEVSGLDTALAARPRVQTVVKTVATEHRVEGPVRIVTKYLQAAPQVVVTTVTVNTCQGGAMVKEIVPVQVQCQDQLVERTEDRGEV